MRSYTPTSSDDNLGHFDLMIKVTFLLHFVARALTVPVLRERQHLPLRFSAQNRGSHSRERSKRPVQLLTNIVSRNWPDCWGDGYHAHAPNHPRRPQKPSGQHQAEPHLC
jgi:hypothetical protein